MGSWGREVPGQAFVSVTECTSLLYKISDIILFGLTDGHAIWDVTRVYVCFVSSEIVILSACLNLLSPGYMKAERKYEAVCQSLPSKHHITLTEECVVLKPHLVLTYPFIILCVCN